MDVEGLLVDTDLIVLKQVHYKEVGSVSQARGSSEEIPCPDAHKVSRTDPASSSPTHNLYGTVWFPNK